jgi:hypothetical protein
MLCCKIRMEQILDLHQSLLEQLLNDGFLYENRNKGDGSWRHAFDSELGLTIK